MRHEHDGLAGKNVRIYKIWWGIKSRCCDPKNCNFHRYGARGIQVADEWTDFKNFLHWAQHNGYQDGLSIDRINNDDGYTPSNCRWASMKQQGRNRRNNVKYELCGQSKSLTEWAEVFGISSGTLFIRVSRLGWSLEKALTTKVAEKDPFLSAFGETKKMSEWCREKGLSRSCFRQRIGKYGYTIEEALSIPTQIRTPR